MIANNDEFFRLQSLENSILQCIDTYLLLTNKVLIFCSLKAESTTHCYNYSYVIEIFFPFEHGCSVFLTKKTLIFPRADLNIPVFSSSLYWQIQARKFELFWWNVSYSIFIIGWSLLALFRTSFCFLWEKSRQSSSPSSLSGRETTSTLWAALHSLGQNHLI